MLPTEFTATSAPPAQHADTSRRRAPGTQRPTTERTGTRHEGAGDEPAQHHRTRPQRPPDTSALRATPETAGHPTKGFPHPLAVSAARRCCAARRHQPATCTRNQACDNTEQRIPARARRRRAGPATGHKATAATTHVGAPRHTRDGWAPHQRVSAPPWPSRRHAAAAQHADTSRRRASRTPSATTQDRGSRREPAGDEPAQQQGPCHRRCEPVPMAP